MDWRRSDRVHAARPRRRTRPTAARGLIWQDYFWRMTRAAAVALALGIVIGFGAAIGLGALRTGGSSFAPIQSYDVLDDGQTLVLAIGIGRLSSIGYVAAEEDASSVRLRVLLVHHPGTATADLLRIDVRTYLESPLGSRSVLDQDGRVIPRRAR